MLSVVTCVCSSKVHTSRHLSMELFGFLQMVLLPLMLRLGLQCSQLASALFAVASTFWFDTNTMQRVRSFVSRTCRRDLGNHVANLGIGRV